MELLITVSTLDEGPAFAFQVWQGILAPWVVEQDLMKRAFVERAARQSSQPASAAVDALNPLDELGEYSVHCQFR